MNMIKAHRQFKKVYLMHQILHIVAAETYSGIEWHFHLTFYQMYIKNFIIYLFLVFSFSFIKC